MGKVFHRMSRGEKNVDSGRGGLKLGEGWDCIIGWGGCWLG